MRKWLGRFLAEDRDGLMDRSSRPAHSPLALDAGKALTVVELRKKRMTQARIAQYLQISKATVSRVLARAGLSKLSDLDPVEPVQRYEHAEPGDLIHIDTKKLGRIETTGHRATGNRRDRTRGAGWEVLFIAIDDHARIAFTELYPDETQENANRFLANTHAYFCSLGVCPKALLTDNRSAFRSRSFKATCSQIEVKHDLHGHIGRRPMARPSASSSQPCVSGLTASFITTHWNVPTCSRNGTITTTGTGRIRVLLARPRCHGSDLVRITSCNFTPRALPCVSRQPSAVSRQPSAVSRLPVWSQRYACGSRHSTGAPGTPGIP